MDFDFPFRLDGSEVLCIVLAYKRIRPATPLCTAVTIIFFIH